MSVGEWLNSVIEPAAETDDGRRRETDEWEPRAAAAERQADNWEERDLDDEIAREPQQRRSAPRPFRDSEEAAEVPVRREGGPYRNSEGREHSDAPRWERPRDRGREDARGAPRRPLMPEPQPEKPRAYQEPRYDARGGDDAPRGRGTWGEAEEAPRGRPFREPKPDSIRGHAESRFEARDRDEAPAPTHRREDAGEVPQGRPFREPDRDILRVRGDARGNAEAAKAPPRRDDVREPPRTRNRDAERPVVETREYDRDHARLPETPRSPPVAEHAGEASRAREEINAVHARLDQLSHQLERLSRRDLAAARPQQEDLPKVPRERSATEPPLTGAPAPIRRTPAVNGPIDPDLVDPDAVDPDAIDPDLAIEQAVAEITARQRALESEAAQTSIIHEPQPAPPPAAPQAPGPPPSPTAAGTARIEASRAARVLPTIEPRVEAPAIDLSGLERQLRELTSRIEALHPSRDIEAAITALRADLAEIGRSITQALPQRAVDPLEAEIRALGERIDRSRQFGIDATALTGLERGLAEVREALHGLKPAEGLVGVDEAVRVLAHKVDALAVGDDPAALRQLETAIGELRDVATHVASNDALARVADDVRSLAAKVDGIAGGAMGAHALSALESRIDTLTSALNASTEAGHAVPKELERLLGGLIEKLEWVQLTHTDHAALAHLEDRIAMLVKRLDASDTRLSRLDGIERGLADLLVHLEQIRTANSRPEAIATPSMAGSTIERDVAEIRGQERRTQDALEAVHGTIEQVVDRLAMIESNLRERPPIPPAPPPACAPTPEPTTPISPEPPPRPAPRENGAQRLGSAESPQPRASAGRAPIDPNLPPDHPLEPGSANGRSSHQPSAAERIAASEAVLGSKPPVVPDPGGGKPDFIAAARRAAQAAAMASSSRDRTKVAAATAPAKPPSQRLRKLIVAAAVVLIVVGAFHLASRFFFDDGGSNPAPEARTDKPTAPPATSPEANTKPTPTPAPVPPAASGKPAPSNPPSAATPAPPSPAPAPRGGRQSSLDDPGQAAANDTGSRANEDKRDDELTAPAKPEAGGSSPAATAAPATNAFAWPTPDITGALPPAVAPLSSGKTSAPPAATNNDKLPATIGSAGLRAAALAGDPSAAYEVATRFAEGRGVPQNNAEAIRWLDRAAKQGFAPAQFRLGGLYEKGTGVKKDLSVARDYYRAAAEQGHGKAMHNLAVLYAEGVGGAADYRTAAHWFLKAANHGVADSQYNLGILYARGIGVEQSLTESYKWFLLAANQGDKDAGRKADEIASRLDQQSLAAARLAAQTWKAEPQPPAAVTVKPPSTWDPPSNTTSGSARPTPRAADVKAAPNVKSD
jgi:localization factor PodJL